MFREDGFRPSDQRGFVHKSFIGRAVGGLVKRFVPAVGIASDIFGGVQSLVRSRARPTLPRSTTARPTLRGEQGKEMARSLKFGGGREVSLPTVTNGAQFPLGFPDVQPRRISRIPSKLRLGNGVTPCEPPLIRSPAGNCIAPTSPRGAELFMGEATMGRYGAAEIPGTMIIDRATCRAGTQLGDDGLCYAKGQITNKQRMWPRGRRPLLTGGDMAAIGTAARAGAKLDRTTKRLRALGMMKALPRPRTTKAHQHAKPVGAVSVT